VIVAIWVASNIFGIRSRFGQPTATVTTAEQVNVSKEQVFLYDYDFEQDIDFDRPANLPCCRIVWHAWVYNSLPHWAEGWYFVEFRDIYGHLLKKLGPIEAKFPNAQEPHEATGDYWMPDDIFKKVDLVKSRIYIQIKN